MSRLAWVADLDVGKAAAAAAADKDKWGGKTINCASCNLTSAECAEALSKASGVKCPYKVL